MRGRFVASRGWRVTSSSGLADRGGGLRRQASVLLEQLRAGGSEDREGVLMSCEEVIACLIPRGGVLDVDIVARKLLTYKS